MDNSKLHEDKKESVVGVESVVVGVGKENKECVVEDDSFDLVEWEGRHSSAVHKELFVLDERVVEIVDGGGGTGNDANTANVGNNNTTDRKVLESLQDSRSFQELVRQAGEALPSGPALGRGGQ